MYHSFLRCLLPLLALAVPPAALASPHSNNNPFEAALLHKRDSTTSNSSLTVDLGYAVYQGVNNATQGLNTWKGIRYATAPVGNLRWQAPRPPTVNRTQTIQANALPTRCPQSPDAALQTSINFTTSILGNEDCLFLSVYAPQNATKLPVLVWIHGGGYGGGAGTQDLSSIIISNNLSFVGVAIQYRLGAFGFMSSDEIHRFGVSNAGLLDQNFALQWVQAYISQFGGDPRQVTISGESAGGGSVMLQAIAYGGYQGTSLYNNIAASSPYLPEQYGYADYVPSQSYYAFAQAVGCFPNNDPQGSAYGSIFQCLVGKDTNTLQNASAYISAEGKYGTWGFLPVTDGVFLLDRPSQQLLRKKVNGLNLLIGNNANEGFSFTPQNITTEDAFEAFVRATFPQFSDSDVAKVLLYYPSPNASVDPSIPKYSTSGYTGATAVNESDLGTGQQQRANNLYAETTFVCPAYWLAEAFSDKGRSSYKYQFSVPPATHGSDVTGFFGPGSINMSPDFVKAFMSIWGNFITTSNPSVSASIANGASSSSSNSSSAGTATGASSSSNPASSWPPFTIASPLQINLNTTGGTAQSVAVNSALNVTENVQPGLKNNFTLVNAYTWEGGRGVRCDFLRSVGVLVPE